MRVLGDSRNLCKYMELRCTGYFRRDTVYMLIVIRGVIIVFLFTPHDAKMTRAGAQNRPVI